MAVAAALVGACGVSTQSAAHVIPAKNVPFGLMATTTSTTTPSPPGEAVTEIFLVSGSHLVPVDRVVNTPVSASDALTALLSGPSNLESFTGISSDIPTGTTIRSTRTNGATLTIDLSGAFATVAGPSQILAIAQIVYTATQIPSVTQVTFDLDGATTEVPSADGTLLKRPVGRADYATLAPGIPAAVRR